MKTDSGLFLDTSAQITRIFGPDEIVREILNLGERHRGCYSSNHVLREFDGVMRDLFGWISAFLDRQLDVDREVKIAELIRRLTYSKPPFLAGGDLFSIAMGSIGEHFQGGLVKPRTVANWARQQPQILRLAFFRQEAFQLASRDLLDGAACCQWAVDHRSPVCMSEPSQERCGLRALTERNALFLPSVRTAIAAKAQEAEALRSSLQGLLHMQGLEYLREITRKYNQFGDLLIFWEVPDGWALLTKERIFRTLKDAHRPGMAVYRLSYAMQEPPSEQRSCTFQAGRRKEWLVGELLLVGATGARFRPLDGTIRLREKQNLVFRSELWQGDRKAVVTEVLERNLYLLRFPVPKKK